MRIVVVLLLVFISLLANDKNVTSGDVIKLECSNNEIKLLEYQNQIFSLYKNVSDVDTKNELLKLKVIENEKYYQKILESQSKKFEIYINQKQSNHNIIVDDLFYMFNIIVALITIGILSIGFILNFVGRKMMKKLIHKQIKEDFNEEITSHQIKQLKENPNFNKLVKDIIAEQRVSDDDVVDDPL